MYKRFIDIGIMLLNIEYFTKLLFCFLLLKIYLMQSNVLYTNFKFLINNQCYSRATHNHYKN